MTAISQQRLPPILHIPPSEDFLIKQCTANLNCMERDLWICTVQLEQMYSTAGTGANTILPKTNAYENPGRGFYK